MKMEAIDGLRRKEARKSDPSKFKEKGGEK